MTTQEVEQVIHEYIQDIYNTKYTGKLYVEKLEPVGYYIKFGLSTPDKPWVLYAALPDELFLPFLKKSLRQKNWEIIHYGELKLTYPDNCNLKNSSCRK